MSRIAPSEYSVSKLVPEDLLQYSLSRSTSQITKLQLLVLCYVSCSGVLGRLMRLEKCACMAGTCWCDGAEGERWKAKNCAGSSHGYKHIKEHAFGTNRSRQLKASKFDESLPAA